MEYRELVEQLTPELVASFRRALELGKWPDGSALSDEQREHTMAAIIAYDQLHRQETDRVGDIDRGKKADQTQTLKWKE